ncbi:recombinase family protein [Curtobacterium sp. MCJR17_020]|uniref:recombinase family protein n=1 Tax=Curtobacterium sp. MCJR17_020 TaxID=2175619 RepID=UPI000DA711CF|nr:recombinase family protein [Curtobacterium sp. MCJR17_020]WIE70807.1 recombinase family protein [Curtobacterium sp. MCJR17_020]
MKRAVLYCRVSRSTEESVSIDRQEHELRTVAEAAGWPVVAVFTDDGLSGRKDRAKADRALAMLEDGEADVLLVWEMSRWSRMGLSAVAKLVGVLGARDGALFVAHKEGLRSDQPAFGIMAAVIAEVAAMEAEGTRDRIKSMRSHVLGQTEPGEMRWLGGSAPFGYRAEARPGGGKRLVIDEDEAPAARTAARMFTTGSSLTEVTTWLQGQGVATPQSPARRARQTGQPVDGLDAGMWRLTTVRKLFLSPTLLGRTTRRVQVGQRADGSPIEEYRVVTDAAGLPIQRWEPVIDPGTWAAIQASIVKRGPNSPKKAASWLSGLLFCGLCGSVLYANHRKDRALGTFRCANKAVPSQKCPGVSIARGALEAYMEGLILDAIGGLDELRVSERVEGADASELEAVAHAIGDLQAALAEDGADYAVLLPKLDASKARRRELLEAPGRVVRTRVATGRTLAEAWTVGGVRERQVLIAGMLHGVEVARPLGSRRPIEERLTVFWHDPIAEDDD